MLSVSANGDEITEINLKFQALKLTEGLNEANEEEITVSNFLAGDNSGDTDIALYDAQKVGIQVVSAPTTEEPKDEPEEEPKEEPKDEPKEEPEDEPKEEPEQPAQQVNELTAAGSIITTIIAVIIVGASILTIRKYMKDKKY